MWSVLIHMFPEANIPVISLSLDYSEDMRYHYELGKTLRVLREQGILMIGSGNIVHNLHAIDWSGEEQYEWAIGFDKRIAEGIENGNHSDILDFQNWGDIARLAHPSYDHLLPLFPLL